MNDDADSGDTTHENRHSKRAMFKDALAKTKNKFKKDEKPKDSGLSEDVNDFLAAGKVSTHPDDVLPATQPMDSSSVNHPRPQHSPRGFPVPRLDMSQTTRFPSARPIGQEEQDVGRDTLRPEGQVRGRSVSFGSNSRPHTRPRNLSVSFDNRPPIIIGLGGDEAEQPPSEISRRRQLAVSLQPPGTGLRPGSSHSHSSQSSVSSARRKPIPQHSPPNAFDDLPPPTPIRRVQTGMETLWNPADKEYEMSLKPPQEMSGVGIDGRYKTAVVSPKPIHPPSAPPRVQSPITPATFAAAPDAYARHQPMTHPVKDGAVQVMVTDDDLIDKQPTLPRVVPMPIPSSVRRNPNAMPVMPHHKIMHRKKPSLNETETMSQGAGGWL